MAPLANVKRKMAEAFTNESIVKYISRYNKSHKIHKISNIDENQPNC
jgi:hypothetical protein